MFPIIYSLFPGPLCFYLKLFLPQGHPSESQGGTRFRPFYHMIDQYKKEPIAMTIKTLMGNGAITGRRISGDHFFLPYICMSVLIFILICIIYIIGEKQQCYFHCESESCSVVSDSAIPWTVGILQARILEWVALLFFRGSSQSRDQTQISHIAGRFFTS